MLVLPTTCKSPGSCIGRQADIAVSEPIALEIVAMNGGNYLGAQLLTGFMYFGAAVFMWFVRAWELGKLESKAVAMHTSHDKLGLVTETPLRGIGDRHGGDVREDEFFKTLVQIRNSIDLSCTRMHVLCHMIHSLCVSLSSYINNKDLSNSDKDKNNAFGPAFSVWFREHPFCRSPRAY